MEFNFTSSGTASITINGGTPTSFTVYRNATNSAGTAYRNFGDFTKSDDCNFDTTGVGTGQIAGYAYVRAYVFAYGLDSTSLNTVVSRPSLLTDGAIALTKGNSS